ncbi:uncharacterized protein K452DRAFT_71868 [Aplosporella prunicola CBS 121167]|uniref:Uncharacterized protein n=1 Tax=Aplosporella prunicola CBS 121167 TaxID=1176127 RepID=A0A6A6BVX9_9PEZI|nr:uncharacterized protein K452DRAFT_71868 [Aplosporella prunicola CBS 121167]KAF2146851.1 hypothetical protein K452DRAFT_71868 [Aplosporella prunicola CBS 121167]
MFRLSILVRTGHAEWRWGSPLSSRISHTHTRIITGPGPGRPLARSFFPRAAGDRGWLGWWVIAFHGGSFSLAGLKRRDGPGIRLWLPRSGERPWTVFVPAVCFCFCFCWFFFAFWCHCRGRCLLASGFLGAWGPVCVCVGCAVRCGEVR